MNKIKLVSFFLALVLSLAFASPHITEASSGSNCQIIYGGGEVCPQGKSFNIDKKILSLGKGESYVDNLSINDSKFLPGQNITFQITIKNTGNIKISDLSIIDTLPSGLTFSSGEGKWDSSSKKLSFNLNLDAGKSKTFTFVAKIPNTQDSTCITNEVKATDSTGMSGNDTAQFCVQRNTTSSQLPQVLPSQPIKQTPPTGVETLGLLALFPSGVLGYFLRKKSSK